MGTPARTSLSEHGFQRYTLSTELGTALVESGYGQLKREFAELPLDPYGEVGLNRYRRHSSAILLPWERKLHWVPKGQDPRFGDVTHYFQGGYNPEHPGENRWFPAISAGAERNPLLEAIVLFDFDQTWWSERERHLPMHVGVHLIKLAVHRDGETAVTSPNVLHQDGEPFHFAHLVYKENATGGINYVAQVQCAGSRPQDVPGDLILAQFDLVDPLDSYGIHDARVSHHLDPVGRAAGPGPGERAVLLVDITPMVKNL